MQQHYYEIFSVVAIFLILIARRYYVRKHRNALDDFHQMYFKRHRYGGALGKPSFYFDAEMYSYYTTLGLDDANTAVGRILKSMGLEVSMVVDEEKRIISEACFKGTVLRLELITEDPRPYGPQEKHILLCIK